MEQPTPYDLEAVHDEQIAPLVDQLVALCQEHRIPMVMSFAYAASEELGVSCCTTALNIWDDRLVDKFTVAARILTGAQHVVIKVERVEAPRKTPSTA